MATSDGRWTAIPLGARSLPLPSPRPTLAPLAQVFDAPVQSVPPEPVLAPPEVVPPPPVVAPPVVVLPPVPPPLVDEPVAVVVTACGSVPPWFPPLLGVAALASLPACRFTIADARRTGMVEVRGMIAGISCSATRNPAEAIAYGPGGLLGGRSSGPGRQTLMMMSPNCSSGSY